MTIGINFGHTAHVQREPGLLATVDDKVCLKSWPHFGKDAAVFGVLSGFDSEQPLSCVGWPFIRQEEINFVIERDVIIKVVGEPAAYAPPKPQVMAVKREQMATNF